MDFSAFDRNPITCDAVERRLVRISGAIEKLREVAPHILSEAIFERLSLLDDRVPPSNE
jgi:hypothetical protein